MAAREDLYVSAAVEADGPIPGVHSMLSFGFAVAGTFDGTTDAPPRPRVRPARRDQQAVQVADLRPL